MSTITTRSGKGSPLTHNEVDANFTNLNTDKYQSGDNVTFGTATVTTFTSTGIDDNATSTAITIDSDGDVGIGTASPLFQAADRTAVTINGTSSSNLVFGVGGSANTYLLADSAGFTIGNTSATLPTMFYTNGSERMRIDSSGNVGIGTASPSAKLTSAGVTGTTIIQALGGDTDGFADVEVKSTGTAGASRLFFSDTAAQSGLIRYSHSTNSMEFTTNATERMRIDSLGNVGIGGSISTAKLYVVGATNDSTQLALRAQNLATSDLFFVRNDGSMVAGIGSKMTLDASGNLGIGTASPANTLDILGDTYSAAFYRNVDVTQSGPGGSFIQIGCRSGSSRVPGAAFGALLDNPATTGDAIIQTRTAGALTEKMRIDTSGNVGIGTTSPAGGATRVVDVYGSSSSAINFHNATSGTTATDGGVVGQYGNDLVLFNYEAGIIQLGTSNTERMRIDSSGRVGIGITPSYTLDIQAIASSFNPVRFSGHGSSIDAFLYTDTAYWSIGDTAAYGGNLWGGNKTSNFVHAYTNGSERMRIDSVGKIGVGLSNPSGSFHLTTKDSGGSDVYFVAQNTTASRLAGYKILDESNNVGGKFQYDNGSNNLLIGAETSSNFQFVTNNAERMRIDSSGNVGIGTTSPGGILHLRSDDNGMIFQSSSSANSRAQIFFQNTGGTTTGKIAVDPDGGNANVMAFSTGSSERMRIDSSGNLLVGKTAANSATAGVQILPEGDIGITRNGSHSLLLNRLTSDGDIALFRKDGATVGSIGSNNSAGTPVLDISANSTSGIMRMLTSGTERMRIDSSGNVGIGRVPNANGVLQLNVGTGSNCNITFSENSTDKWLIGNVTGSDALRFYDLANVSERMRIDSSGRVGINTTPSAWLSTWRALQFAGDTGESGSVYANFGGTSGAIGLAQNWYYNGSVNVYLESAAASDYGQFSGTHWWRTATSGTAGTTAVLYERMRLTNDGNLLVGTTSASAKLTIVQPSGADREVILAGIDGVSNGFQVRYISGAMQYVLTGLGTGTVSSSAGVLSASSDQNMKIADGCVDNALDKISALTPRYFYWKDENGNSDIDKGRQLGFFAQEVNKVVPEAAPEPRDDQNGWGVLDRSLVATLVKAIQEQQAMIETLQAQVAELQGA